MGQAEYEYKHLFGVVSRGSGSDATVAELNDAVRGGWRVAAVPMPAKLGEYFLLLLERQIPDESSAQTEIDRLRLEAAKIELEAAELRLVKVKEEIEMARMSPLRNQPDIHPSLCWPEPALGHGTFTAQEPVELARELDTSPPGSTAHNNLVLGHVRARNG